MKTVAKSKKGSLDMSVLLATRGEDIPADAAAIRPSTSETEKDEPTNRRILKARKTPSSEFVNLGFKVPKEFRHRLRKIAAAKDVSLVEVLREAVDLYEKANSI
jgi:plasmid replication initiation protein